MFETWKEIDEAGSNMVCALKAIKGCVSVRIF